MPLNGLPTQSENPNGLHRRYIITKADGSEVDPHAIYFVLRLDNFGDDIDHIMACRRAARAYADSAPVSMRQVARELSDLVARLDAEMIDSAPG